MFGTANQKQISGISGPASAKLSMMDKIGALGGMLMDADGTMGRGNFATAQAGNDRKLQMLNQKAQQDHQQKLLLQAMKGVPVATGQAGAGNAPAGQSGGLTPQQAMIALNPQAWSQAQAQRTLGHHTVNAGNSVVTYGPGGQPNMTQAAQNFQHGNLVGTAGPGGFTVNDMGASNADINTATGHQVTNRGNTLEHAAAMRGHDVSEGNNVRTTGAARMGHQLGYDADMAQLEFDKTQPGGGVNYGKTPVFGQDVDGNPVIGVIGDNGTFKPLDTGGVTPLGPEGRAFAAQAGKFRAEDERSDRQTAAGAPEAIETIDRLLTGDMSEGLDGAFGWNGGLMRRIPGSDARTAAALVNEVVGPETLDELSKMKGVPSDRDIDLVKGAATALNDPGISVAEARRELVSMRAGLERIMALPNVGGEGAGSGGLTAEEKRELAELERRFGG